MTSPEMKVDLMRESTVRRIKGPTILLGSGTYFDFENPEAATPTIEDVAYGLAFTCRFAGQCAQGGKRIFYSVAEHCVRMSWAVPEHLAYPALMHELGEAVCGDMTGPLKLLCPDYKVVEKRCAAALAKFFSVPDVDPVELKRWDIRMLATERRDLMPWHGEEWSWLAGIAPLLDVIDAWPAEFAAAMFMGRYRALRRSGA